MLNPIFGAPSDFTSDTTSSNIISDLTCPAHAFQLSDCDLQFSNSSDGCLFQTKIIIYDNSADNFLMFESRQNTNSYFFLTF